MIKFQKKILNNFLGCVNLSSKNFSYYQKPILDLRRSLTDVIDFKELWAANTLNLSPPLKQKDLFKGSSALNDKSLMKVLRGHRLTEIDGDLQTITNMIKGSVY